MRYFAANYFFDGESFVKNALISVDDSFEICFSGKPDEGLIERQRMIFYSGIIMPDFNIIKKRNNQDISILSSIMIKELINYQIHENNLAKALIEIFEIKDKILSGSKTKLLLLQNLVLTNLTITTISNFIEII
ncbi:MAG: hypothetical protein LBV69_09800 [Bacteroidales bacterium]|jgi:hypothetical protein|nr:hypothetical protein [Bacteroidales bacterium]